MGGLLRIGSVVALHSNDMDDVSGCGTLVIGNGERRYLIVGAGNTTKNIVGSNIAFQQFGATSRLSNRGP